MFVMKKLTLFLLPLLVFAFCSCEEEEAELRFSTVSNSNPNTVRVRYESPDPMHCPKMYTIETNREASELILKCKDANNIYIANTEAESPSFYHCDGGHWSAEIISSNKVKITLEKYELDPETSGTPEYFKRNYLVIAAKPNHEELSTVIDINRWY